MKIKYCRAVEMMMDMAIEVGGNFYKITIICARSLSWGSSVNCTAFLVTLHQLRNHKWHRHLRP